MPRSKNILDTLPSLEALRRRIAELDRERKALLVLLRARQKAEGVPLTNGKVAAHA